MFLICLIMETFQYATNTYGSRNHNPRINASKMQSLNYLHHSRILTPLPDRRTELVENEGNGKHSNGEKAEEARGPANSEGFVHCKTLASLFENTQRKGVGIHTLHREQWKHRA
jgi:hypothetical protein